MSVYHAHECERRHVSTVVVDANGKHTLACSSDHALVVAMVKAVLGV